MTSRAARLCRSTAFVIAIAGMLGHVCPPYAAAAPAGMHRDMPDEHEGEPARGGLHAASCDAVSAAAPATVAVPAVASGIGLALPAPAPVPPSTVAVTPRATSPPRFLLHAALLI